MCIRKLAPATLAALIAGGSAFALFAGGTGNPQIASVTREEVCVSDGRPGSAYSRAHRVVARARVPGHQIDHIVPLCLGGADVDANIQIEPIAEALRKDDLERDICIAVCRYRSMTLAEGQAIFLSGEWKVRVK